MNFYYNDKIDYLGENKLCVTLYQKPVFTPMGFSWTLKSKGLGTMALVRAPAFMFVELCIVSPLRKPVTSSLFPTIWC